MDVEELQKKALEPLKPALERISALSGTPDRRSSGCRRSLVPNKAESAACRDRGGADEEGGALQLPCASL
jgi:hypothetical protein